jgi:hypothetical protein
MLIEESRELDLVFTGKNAAIVAKINPNSSCSQTEFSGWNVSLVAIFQEPYSSAFLNTCDCYS